MLALVLFSDLRMEKQFDNDTGKTVSIANENAPSIGFLSCCILMFGIGYWLADVMADSIVVSSRLFSFLFNSVKKRKNQAREQSIFSSKLLSFHLYILCLINLLFN